MTRSLLTIAVLSLGIATQSQAQSLKKYIAPTSKAAIQQIKAQRVHDALLRQLTGSGQAKTAAKTTSTVTDERLIANSTYRYFDTSTVGVAAPVWKETDSTTHHYSGQHGSYYNYNGMTYVNYYQLYNSVFLGQGAILGLRDKDNKPEILSDSSRYYGLVFTDTMDYYETISSVFDAADNITTYSENFPPFAFTAQTINTFVADGIATVATLDNSSGTLDTTGRRTLGYTAGKLTADSSETHATGIWDHLSSYTYTYDMSGKATRMSLWTYDATAATPWYENYRYDLEYYPSGQFKKMTVSYSDPSTPLTINETDTFAWTPGISYYTFVRSTYYNTPSSINSYYTQVKHVSSANNLPDSVYNITYDPNIPDTTSRTLDVYTYDTYNKPTNDITYTNHVGGTAYDSIITHQHYYYETYTRDATGVNTVVATVGSINIYPNPATNQLNITQSNITAGNEIATVKVYNLTGQLVINSSYSAASGKAQISIDNLSDGTYLVLLQNNKGEILHKEKIVKL